MNILVTTGIFPPDVGGPAKFVPLIADKLSEKNNLKVITLSEKTVEDSHNDYEVFRIIRNQNKVSRFIKTLVLIIKNAVHSNINFLPLMYIFPILILITCIFIINNNKKYDIFSQLTNKANK